MFAGSAERSPNGENIGQIGGSRSDHLATKRPIVRGTIAKGNTL